MNQAKSQLVDPLAGPGGQAPVDRGWSHPGRNPETKAPSLDEPEQLTRPRPEETGNEEGVCSHPVECLVPVFPARDFISGHQFAVALCRACGLTVTSPQPAAQDLAAYYPEGYYGALANRRFPGPVEALQQALYTHRVKQVEAAGDGQPGRVLDVGCGRGLLLREFRRRGWEVHGTELSEQAAQYPRRTLNLPVETGRLETIGFPANHFDAVTLWHVLEHVSQPRTLLAEINRILKPGGVLLVSVPNFGGWEARWFRDKWFHLDVPRHVTHLTRARLEQALGEAGFQGHEWSGFTPEYDAFSFVQSALNQCGLRHNLLYDLLRGKTAKVIGGAQAPRWQILASLAFGFVFGLASIPVTLGLGFLGQGGTMTVLATKQAEPRAASKTLWDLVFNSIPKRSAQA